MREEEKSKRRRKACLRQAAPKFVLAGLAECVDPGDEHFVEGGLENKELDAHADTGLDDADNDESLEGLALSDEFHARACIHRKRFAGADETSAERNVRGDAVHLFAGFHVDQFNVSSEGEADGVAAITDSREAGI